MAGPIKGFIKTFVKPARGGVEGTRRFKAVFTDLHDRVNRLSMMRGKPMDKRYARVLAIAMTVPGLIGLSYIVYAPQMNERFAGLVVAGVWLFFVAISVFG